jgi:hypothetical protein
MQQPVHQPERPEKPRRRVGAFGRFMRGYLMLVGAGTTIYVLIQLLVKLFVEIEAWMGPVAPMG